jgi:hypothetical protein
MLTPHAQAHTPMGMLGNGHAEPLGHGRALSSNLIHEQTALVRYIRPWACPVMLLPCHTGMLLPSARTRLQHSTRDEVSCCIRWYALFGTRHSAHDSPNIAYQSISNSVGDRHTTRQHGGQTGCGTQTWNPGGLGPAVWKVERHGAAGHHGRMANGGGY